MNPAISDANPLLLLVDGHSLAFRSYYAFAKGREGGLRTKTGIPTSVCYGFLKALLEVLEIEKPQYVAIAFDLSEKTFRHEADDTYKEGRPDTPEDFLPDLQNLQELLATLNLAVLTAPGYEADDIIGTLTRRATTHNLQVKILSGDRDLFQLVDESDTVKVLYLSTTYGKGAPPPREFGPQQVKEKLGIAPAQVVDFKALCGDTSDNIPGVRGIGEKTAVRLLTSFGSLAGIYEAIDQIKGAERKKLEVGKASALHSQFMAQIHLDVPLDVDLESLKLQDFDEVSLVPLLEKLEFRTFLSKIKQLHQQLRGEPTQAAEADPEAVNPPALEDEDLWFFSAEDTPGNQGLRTVPITPLVIDTAAKLDQLVTHLKTCTDSTAPVAWDTETTSLEPRDAKLVGIGCCWGGGLADMAYIPIGHTRGTCLEKALVLQHLRPILEDARYPKALQNAKYDRLVLRCQGVELVGVVFDTMLASYVLNPERSHNLSDLSLAFLGIQAQSYTDLVPKGKTIAEIAIPTVANYCGMDAYTTYLLVKQLRAELEPTPGLLSLLLNVEQPLEPVLADMEYTGVRIDQAYLKQFSQSLEQDLAQIEEQAYESAGETFNLGSPKQLSELLFERLDLDRRKSRKTKSGGYSTDAATLEKLQGDHPVIDAILEYRTLAKLKSTYVDALPALVRQDTGRVHTDFNQAITATGRLSSSDPNLQNIPIRTAFSRQIRKAFIPESGWVIVAADYSQIELRILAHLSQEPTLVETYRQNGDVHSLTARLLLDKSDISQEERRLAKIINFGVIYGMGAQRFAREAGVSVSEGKAFIDRFYQRYPKVFEYLQQMQRDAIAQGYVETILGRRRYFNFSSDSLRRLRGSHPNQIDLSKIRARDQYDAQLLRAAANAPIQGSSADIIKVAMVKLHQQLQAYQARLLLQVHDELVFEMPPDEWETLQSQITGTMESAQPLSVPLKVEIHAGQNWMDAK
ncbi:MAG: DNA polymerase I [Leptolyngbyaceae cyanobacterium]